jgi:hypothetical protein
MVAAAAQLAAVRWRHLSPSIRGRHMSDIPFSIYDFFGYLASGVIVIGATDLALGGPLFDREAFPFGQSLLLVAFAYLLGHVVAHLSSAAFESFLVRRVLKSPEDHMFREKQSPTLSRILPGYSAPLPARTRTRILQRSTAAGFPVPGRDLFYHCHATVRHDEATSARLNTFLYLYGFSRNTSLALLYSAIVFLLVGVGLFPRISSQLQSLPLIPLAITSLLLSCIMLLRYLKFFRHFTLEVFVSYSEPSTKKRE